MKRISLAIAGLAVTSATLMAAAVPAGAFSAQASGFDRCPDNHFCIFEHSDGTGLYAAFEKGSDDLNDPAVFGGRMNDKASAVWNRTDSRWCIYEHRNQGGRNLLIDTKRGAGSKGALSAGWQDITSSVRPARWNKPPRFPHGWWSCR